MVQTKSYNFLKTMHNRGEISDVVKTGSLKDREGAMPLDA